MLKKRKVRLMQNVLAFYLKCTCVLIQTYLRFGLNALAFLKELRVLLFLQLGSEVY